MRYLALSILALCLSTFAQRIELTPANVTGTRHMEPDVAAKLREGERLGGIGDAWWTFTVQQAGWREVRVRGGRRFANLYLDDTFIRLVAPYADTWPAVDRMERIVNLYLTAGEHTLRLERGWFPGLPGIQEIVLEPSTDITGMVRLVPAKDYMAFRRGEQVGLTVRAGRQPAAATVVLEIVNPGDGQVVGRQEVAVPAGEGLVELSATIPTDREGSFDIRATDAAGQPVDRVLQYVVVDPAAAPTPAPELAPELVQTIDCATVDPAYSIGATRVVTSPAGAYRESADRGHVEFNDEANWFAYTLSLPTVQEPYLLQVDYPDDQERTFTYSVIERDLPGGRTLTGGVASGGMYRLTGKLQTAELVFYPRQTDPRVQLRTWWTGQRAAAAQIRVYRLAGGFPDLGIPQPTDRLYGRYQEEPHRYVQWGARPEGDTWQNLLDPAERIGQYSRWTGMNLWAPTIAIYGGIMYPSKFIPSLDRQTPAWATVGPASEKDPMQKDSVRLLLLVAEKYHMKFIGELYPKVTRTVMKLYFEERFGGDGNIDWEDPTTKPWLIVHRTGGTPGSPTFNPLYPGVQDWVADVVGELANRYRDLPAFRGVGLRFMSWQFGGWQGLPSIEWGYGDYTIGRFQADTGIEIPVAADDPQRFEKRYQWLMANAYDQWVDWRCARIGAYHARLAKIIADARPDMKLFLDVHGPQYSSDLDFNELRQKGRVRMFREAGLDPAACAANPAIVLRDSRQYPPGIRGTRTKDPLMRAGRIAAYLDPTGLDPLAEPAPGGTVTHVHVNANSYESNVADLADLGLARPEDKKTSVHGAGLVFPAGRHYLRRYANAMADGNIVQMSDGSHGYIQQPPTLCREFTREYRALPAIGMTRLEGAADPVAVWSGQGAFYVVNRTSWPVRLELRFAGPAQVTRLSTGQAVAADGDRLRLELDSYELRGFGIAGDNRPTALDTRLPAAAISFVGRQVAFVHNLVKLDDASLQHTVLPFSQVDLQRARQRAEEARQAFAENRPFTVNRTLLHPDLVKLYVALDAWPPRLWDRGAPAAPEGASLPRDLLPKARPDAGVVPVVVPGVDIAPGLAGREALAWQNGAVEIPMDWPYDGRYRVVVATLDNDTYGPPTFAVAGHDLHAPAATMGDGWVRQSLLVPPVDHGDHALRIAAAGGRQAGVLFIRVEPVRLDIPSPDWAVVGPFDGVRNLRVKGAVAEALAATLPPEQARGLAASYQGQSGQRLRWQGAPGTDDYVDLFAATGKYSSAIGYAVTYLETPAPKHVALGFGLDYWGKIWLNDEEVFAIAEGHGAPCKNQFEIPVDLAAGRNELLVKVHAGSRGNGFWMTVTDAGTLAFKQPLE